MADSNLIPRVLFDRSILHGDRFMRLKQSPLAAKISKRKLQLLYTPLFVEETLQFGMLNSDDFNPQWDYLISLNRSKWFKTTNEILALELGNRAFGRKYYFRDKEDVNQITQNVPALVTGKIPLNQLSEARSQIDRNNLIRDELRRQRVTMRKSYPQQPYDFEEVATHNAEWYIEKGLMQWHQNSAGYLETWRKQSAKCRFAQSHIRAALAIFYLPLVDHRLRIDINDKSDAEQLAFMEWGDIFVSDDTRFMRRAFELLYARSKKLFMSSSEFITYMRRH